MTRQLRDYQAEAVDSVRSEWQAGRSATTVILPTGTGKTDVIGRLVTDEAAAGGRALVLAHRGELLDQITARCGMHNPRLPIGRVQAGADQTRRPIVVAMTPTLAKAERRERLPRPSLVVVDECFPAGTLVGDVPIETIRTGDYVDSWDELAARPVRRRVTATMRSRPSSLVRVATDEGEVVCTPGHTFLTLRGWTPAVHLEEGDHVISAVHRVLNVGGTGDHPATIHVEAVRPDLLLGRLSSRAALSPVIGSDGADEQAARLEAHAGAQSDALSRGARTHVGELAEDRPSASRARWQWDRRHGAAGDPRGRAGLADGSGLRDAHRRASVALQAGHRAPDDEGLRRGRRRFARLAPGLGRPQGRTVALARVAGVQVLEPGRDGTYGGLCPGGVVYNLEVEGAHTYRVGAAGLVAHNCHHITSPSNLAILEWAGCLDETDPTRLLGVTATPSRSDDAKRGIGMVLQSVAFSRDIAWAIRGGWLVPPRGLAVVTSHMDLDTAKLNRGDYQDRDLGEMVSQDVGEIVRAWQTYAVDADYPQGRITIAFTPTVAAAAELAAAFELAGVKAEAVLGSTKQPEREAVYARLAAGVTRVLVGVAVMTEGFDSPPVSCVLMARPTRSKTVYTQAVGRGLRLHDGKADCLVLDVVGSSRGQKLVTLAELHPGAPYASTDPTVTRESLLEPAEKPGPARLQGPATYAEVDLLGETVLRWLVTSQGVRFLVAGERVIYLWPDTNNPRRSATWSIITANLKGDHAQPGDVARDVPLTLEEATTLAEAHALELVPDLVAEQNRPWHTARVSGRSGQVTYARLLGIARPEAYTRGRLSDEMDVLMASARLAQAARWTA